MNTKRYTVGLIAAAVFIASNSMGQNPVVTSFQGNGQVSWTNAVNSNALYRIEWAAQATGPWYRTFANIGALDGHGANSFTVHVPMFYRVVMTTNQPPQGMVWIDGGDFAQGEAGINGPAVPVHTNFVSGFWMDEMEVTREKWREVYNWAVTNDYVFQNSGLWKTNNHPVHSVSWYDAVKWCNARSQRERLTPCYYTGPTFTNIYKNGALDISNSWVNWSANGYRLPTEAEWEKAARGGRQQRLFPWGADTIQHARANYFAATNSYSYDTSPTPSNHPAYNDGIFPYTSPAGSFPANGYGLHDMAGNVSEWCWDLYANYSATYEADPHGPDVGQFGVYRIIRGGSWAGTAVPARCADRNGYIPSDASTSWGFRCVRGP